MRLGVEFCSNCRTEMAEYITDISALFPHIYCIVIVSANKNALISYFYRFMEKIKVNYRIVIVSVKPK